MFTPGLTIFYVATIHRPSHSIGRWQHAGAWALERRHSSPTSPSRRRADFQRHLRRTPIFTELGVLTHFKQISVRAFIDVSQYSESHTPGDPFRVISPSYQARPSTECLPSSGRKTIGRGQVGINQISSPGRVSKEARPIAPAAQMNGAALSASSEHISMSIADTIENRSSASSPSTSGSPKSL